MSLLKPKKLKKGDVIGLISPASTPKDLTRIEKAVKYFEGLGYGVEVGKNVGKEYGYLAGRDEERLEDLHYMFKNKNVKAIVCVRGGYGTPRLLRNIDFRLIKKNPKIFVGYSDITALQMSFLAKANLITFAGPMAAVDFYDEVVNPYTEEHFWWTLTSDKKIGEVKLPNDEYKMDFATPVLEKGKKISSSVTGRIIGGNLTLFVSLLGTRFFPKLEDLILFIEDIDEVPYRIDRYFTQIFNSKLLKKVNGLILGQFTDCEEKEADKKTLTLSEVFDEYLSEIKVPCVRNFPHGHVKENFTFPFGIKTKINIQKQTVEFLESGVE